MHGMGCIHCIKRETGENPVRSRRREAGLAISYATGKLGRRNRVFAAEPEDLPMLKTP